MKKIYTILLSVLSLIIFIFINFQSTEIKTKRLNKTIRYNDHLKNKWMDFSGGKKGKLIFADPPYLVIIYLHNGTKKKVFGIKVEGGKGRINRGKTPRPFWSYDGTLFSYRYFGNIYVSNEDGLRKIINNSDMDTSNETRWSLINLKGEKYLFGPSKRGTAIAVSIDNPANIVEIFPYPIIDKHCELTEDGKNIVYNNGNNIFIASLDIKGVGIKISHGQNCRPCISPMKYAAWLTAPHKSYNLHSITDGKFVKELKAPLREEIYRLNWSNKEEFAVHMFGSRGNTRMHIRKISTGESLYVGNGWDPDLWVGNIK